MRLTAIEAIRYGALEGECLAGLSDGLTVVLGPNESGKTTMTALTRHVLYGYPDGRSKERSYTPQAGARVARLVFSDPSGEWAIERVDGKNRGPVSVVARAGIERPELLGELVGGVSEQTYRVVFGFGLDELAQIESGDNADIVSRLYAAGYGLAVNPMDARKHLVAAADELYAPRASKPVVNALASKMRELKAQIGALEAQATEYAGEQVRLGELAEDLASLRSRRDSLDLQLRALEQDATRLTAASEEIEALEAQAREADAAIADGERGIALIDVDERVIAAGPELSAVLDETSGFRQRLESIASAENAAEDVDRRVKATALPEDARDSVENRAALDAWRDRLAELRVKAEAAEESARRVEAQAASTEKVAADTAVGPAASNRLPFALAVGAVVVGVAFVAAGLMLRQPLASVLGAVVLLVGAIAGALGLSRRPSSADAGTSLSADAARLRADAEAQRTLATAATAELEVAKEEWRAWLAAAGLDAHGDDPAAVRSLLDELAERQRLLVDAERHRETASRERDAAEAWVVRLVDAIRRYDDSGGQIVPLAEATGLAARAKRDLEVAREAAAERAQLTRELEVERTERRRIGERLDSARAVSAQIAGRHELDPATALPALRSLVDRTAAELSDVRAAHDALAREHSELTGRLNTEGRDNAMAIVRQQIESARAQAADAADRYLVAALGVSLLDGARERFERERQPEVVRTAGRVFSAMTDGRYIDVRVPLDNSGISVVTADGTVRSTADLSRGTAEQLYLALRVGLIGALKDQGRSLPILMDDVVVNFDPERRSGAVQAVSELAALRQVVFFTCHPETAEALTEAVSGAVLVTLDRCSLSG